MSWDETPVSSIETPVSSHETPVPSIETPVSSHETTNLCSLLYLSPKYFLLLIRLTQAQVS